MDNRLQPPARAAAHRPDARPEPASKAVGGNGRMATVSRMGAGPSTIEQPGVANEAEEVAGHLDVISSGKKPSHAVKRPNADPNAAKLQSLDKPAAQGIRSIEVDELYRTILTVERKRQAEAKARRSYAPRPGLSYSGADEERFWKTKKAARYFGICVKIFLSIHAPNLHPVTTSTGKRGRRHIRWDSVEIKSYADRLTNTGSQPIKTEDELSFIRAQLEKRLE